MKPRDREDVIVHAVIALIGAIGVTAGMISRNVHAGFVLAMSLVVIGVHGALRR